MTTIAIADDHRMVLEGLEQLFARHHSYQVVSSVTNGFEALAVVREKRPDVLVLDVSMEGMSGIEVLRRIHEEEIPTRVLLLTAAIDDSDVVEAMNLGVWGIVLKESASVQLVRAVDSVMKGERVLEPALVGKAVAKMSRSTVAEREIAKILSPRETEVARMVASGLRNREIAEKLNLSEGTVKSYLHSIYQKLDLRGRVELTLYAREKGLV
ncbi:MAG: response regulator transcription factor [Thermoanaerobaculia bacterium]|nr:response regulator transcription factor [Thermoanaerobaculia bacterium]